MFSFIHLLPLFFFLSLAAAVFQPPTFNVMSYGARSGPVDNSNAFLRAWHDACTSNTGGTVFIPGGNFVLGAVVFEGPCKGPVNFIISKGTLEASDSPANMFAENWITFSHVDQLLVSGSGYLRGHGRNAWSFNDCAKHLPCRRLPFTMRFEFVTNSRINYLQSIDSRSGHFDLFECHKVEMSHIWISAPADSPNTDGIHLGASSQIGIYDSTIMTGDDCVSMVAGTHDVDIQRVQCGPGHGFSIGSLGKNGKELPVSGITVRDSRLSGTQNGLRIKTWAPSEPSLASDIFFDNILMDNVGNPIFIDQQYCPHGICNHGQVQSNVQVKNVTFSRVRGTSSTQHAVQLVCSKNVPCEDIKLIDINLAYNGHDGPVASFCQNAVGKAYGFQQPSGCL